MIIEYPKNKTQSDFEIKFPDGAIELHPKLLAVSFAMQFTGIRTLTDSNAKKLLERLQFAEKIGGAIYKHANGDTISIEDIKEYIGLKVHTVNKSLPTFLKEQWAVHQNLS